MDCQLYVLRRASVIPDGVEKGISTEVPLCAAFFARGGASLSSLSRNMVSPSLHSVLRLSLGSLLLASVEGVSNQGAVGDRGASVVPSGELGRTILVVSCGAGLGRGLVCSTGGCHIRSLITQIQSRASWRVQIQSRVSLLHLPVDGGLALWHSGCAHW